MGVVLVVEAAEPASCTVILDVPDGVVAVLLPEHPVRAVLAKSAHRVSAATVSVRNTFLRRQQKSSADSEKMPGSHQIPAKPVGGTPLVTVSTTAFVPELTVKSTAPGLKLQTVFAGRPVQLGMTAPV